MKEIADITSLRRNTSALCWTARVISLLAGGVFVVLLLIAPIAELIRVDYPTEMHRETYRNLGWSLLVLVPLIPAAIAWQRRLIGSRSMVLLYSATMLMLVVLLVIVPAVTSTAMEYGVIITVPILLVIVAWRWHLIGGISIVLWFACYFAALMYINSGFGSDGSESFAFLSPLAILFLISGMLYLIVWRREKRKGKHIIGPHPSGAW